MSDAVKLYGTQAPAAEQRQLNAGALSATLENGQIRHVRWQGREAIRGIAFLIRDINWGTYPVEIADLTVQTREAGFSVSYRATCGDEKQRLRYEVRIEASASELSYKAVVHPETNFITNRAGFIVLHPLDGVAGESLTVTHTDGRVEQANFPKHVAPSQPLFDIRTLEHQVAPGVTCVCTMAGDAFELEDQRNWSDASFKTYIRPLAKPFPYTLAAGAGLEQSVTLRFRQETPVVEVDANAGRPHVLTLSREVEGKLPDLGIAIDEEEASATQKDLEVLAALNPQWLVFRVGPKSPASVMKNLRAAAAVARARVLLEVVVNHLEEVAEIGGRAREVGLEVAAVAVTPAAFLKTVPAGFVAPGIASLEALHQATRQAFPGARLGGGTLAYFTELNRNPPPGVIDFLTHTTCPIIHAADDHSVMETLEALPWLFESGRRLANTNDYRLGPTALGMRFNPYGAAPAANAELGRVAMAKLDPRQRGLFGAAFYTAYAAIAARAGLRQITLSALGGAHGVLPSAALPAVAGGCVHPAFVALEWLARGAGKPMVSVDVSGDKGIEALAYASGSEMILLVVNTTADAKAVALVNVPGAAARVLEEATLAEATGSTRWGQGDGSPIGSRLQLAPYAVARLQVSRG